MYPVIQPKRSRKNLVHISTVCLAKLLCVWLLHCMSRFRFLYRESICIAYRSLCRAWPFVYEFKWQFTHPRYKARVGRGGNSFRVFNSFQVFGNGRYSLQDCSLVRVCQIKQNVRDGCLLTTFALVRSHSFAFPRFRTPSMEHASQKHFSLYLTYSLQGKGTCSGDRFLPILNPLHSRRFSCLFSITVSQTPGMSASLV